MNIKKHFTLIATFVVIAIAGIGGYYLTRLKPGPYPVASFVSLSYEWGAGDTLINHYQSATGDYQYLNNRDSLVKTKVKLRANDMIFVHNKLNELGFWNLPKEIGSADSLKSPVYKLEFKYLEKTKLMIIHSNDNSKPLQLDSAMRIKDMLQQVIDEAENRYNN